MCAPDDLQNTFFIDGARYSGWWLIDLVDSGDPSSMLIHIYRIETRDWVGPDIGKSLCLFVRLSMDEDVSHFLAFQAKIFLFFFFRHEKSQCTCIFVFWLFLVERSRLAVLAASPGSIENLKKRKKQEELTDAHACRLCTMQSDRSDSRASPSLYIVPAALCAQCGSGRGRNNGGLSLEAFSPPCLVRTNCSRRGEIMCSVCVTAVPVGTTVRIPKRFLIGMRTFKANKEKGFLQALFCMQRSFFYELQIQKQQSWILLKVVEFSNLWFTVRLGNQKINAWHLWLISREMFFKAFGIVVQGWEKSGSNSSRQEISWSDRRKNPFYSLGTSKAPSHWVNRICVFCSWRCNSQ